MADPWEEWSDDWWIYTPGGLFVLAWVLVGSGTFALLRSPKWLSRLRTRASAKTDARSHATTPGAFTLLSLGILLILYRWRAEGHWLQFVLYYFWMMAWFYWLVLPRELAQASSTGRVRSGRTRMRTLAAYALLWLNGSLFLLIGSSGFLRSGGLAGWTQKLGILSGWLVLCVLLGFSTFDPQRALGRIPYGRALAATLFWAGALIAFNGLGGHWVYESSVYADPLSICQPVPPASEETYDRIIRSSVPPSYRRNDPNALPEYIDYMAPEDMDTFLARRRTEGRPLDEQQLKNLLDKSARDVRPVIRRALVEMDAARQSQQNQD